MSAATRKTIFIIYTVLFIGTAAYHLVGMFIKINDSPVWRHLLFVVLNVFCAYGINKRPSFFTIFFALFTLQQTYSHGGDIITKWKLSFTIDYLSIAVILLSIGMLALLLTGKKKED